jgi:hypothetical protein
LLALFAVQQEAYWFGTSRSRRVRANSAVALFGRTKKYCETLYGVQQAILCFGTSRLRGVDEQISRCDVAMITMASVADLQVVLSPDTPLWHDTISM